MRTRVMIVAMVGFAGCFKGEFPNCAVACATNAECPDGLACSPQGLCSTASACTATSPQSLTVMLDGDGAVTSDPGGIDCGTTCNADFPPGSSVTLTSAAGANTVFDSWTGDCSGSTGTCSLTMDARKNVGARFLQHGARRWVSQISFSGDDYLDGELEVDAQGDVIAAGSVDDGGTRTLYVVKYSKVSGNVIWEQKIPAPNFGFNVGGLDTDSSGNVYVCTRFSGNGSMTIGGKIVAGDLFGNVLALRLAAADGAIEWVKDWGGSAQELCGGVAVSGTDVFFTGYTSSNPSTFDGVTLTGSTNNAYIVRAATSNGTVAAGKLLAGSFDVRDIAAANGQVAIAGSFRTNYTIDSCGLSLSGTGTDGMIMNFSSALTCTWSVDFGSLTSGEDTSAIAIAPYPGGGWVATGSFVGAVLFATSGTSIQSNGMADAFVARYAANGAHVWSFGYGGTGNDAGFGIDVTPTGEVVFAGEFASTITLGLFTLTGTNDIFITRMSAGNTPGHQWATKIGGTAFELLDQMHVDGDGTVSILTSWTGMTDVGGMALTGQGYDAYVASFVR